VADREVEVLIVGAGPTGLACANLLAAAGVEVLVIEREADVAAEPRAVSIDDEAMRLLQSLGLPREPNTAIAPGTGTRYYGARGQLLAAAAAPTPPPLGHPLKNPIDHGEFTRLLLDALRERESAEVRFACGLVGLEDGGNGAVAKLDGADGEEEVGARFLLGCDGGRSTVRGLLGIAMEGSSVDEPWLVVDTVGDPHDERYAMHHGDPLRPHVILPGPGGRCRYEFLLLPGEDADAATDFETVRGLLEPHRGPVAADDVVRRQVYVFHALLAERWRSGPVFLLGDAAHMMPPFAGQGLSTGLRDAANLAWKLAAVLGGRLGDAVLRSYEQERRPHAKAMVELSVRRGRVVMTRNHAAARARDGAIWLARRSPALRRRLERLPLKPLPRHAEGLALRGEGAGAAAIVGAMLPQPRVLDAAGGERLLDDVIGPGFALIEVDPPPGAAPVLASPLWGRLGARRIRLCRGERFPAAGLPGDPPMVADLDGLLDLPLADCAGLVLVVRPDRFVMGAFAAAEEESFVARWGGLEPRAEKTTTRSV
jgi:3-(3-hydroxy-phenyl)propionate hydroxylase